MTTVDLRAAFSGPTASGMRRRLLPIAAGATVLTLALAAAAEFAPGSALDPFALAGWAGTPQGVAAIYLLAAALGSAALLHAWHAQRRLRKERFELHTAINNVLHGLVMFDASERVVVFNRRYLELSGLSYEFMASGVTLRDLLRVRQAQGRFSQDIEEYRRELLADLASGRSKSLVVETQDGRAHRVISVPLPDGGWVATHDDVTDKVRIERLNERQKHQLDSALSNMSQGLCMFDAEQRLIVCNRQYADLYRLNEEQTRPGTTLREILTHRIAVGAAPEDHENYFRDRINEVMVNEPYQIINRLRDGRHVSVVHRPMPGGGWVATHEDVTEATRREESFRLLFEGNPVPMWVIDQETLRFLAVNDAAVALYGFNRDQFMNMTVPDLRPPNDRERFIAHLRSLPEVQFAQNVGQHWRADGSVMDVSILSRGMTYGGRNARLTAIHDITKVKLAETQLIRTKKFLDTVIEHVPLPIMVKDVPDSASDPGRFKISLVNRAYEEFIGVSRTQLVGKTAMDLFSQERAELSASSDRETLESDEPVITSEYQISTHARGPRTVVSRKTAIRDENGRPQYLLSVLDDITERRRAERRIAHLAHHDTLSDLPNRAAFNERVAETYERCKRASKPFAILSIDLDRFKEANDAFGHSMGDALLHAAAQRLYCAADDTFLARVGGDEFTAIVTDGPLPATAQALGERMLDAFAEEFDIDGHRLKLGISIGGAVYPHDGADLQTLMANADAALYRVKTEMRGTVQFFEAELAARLREKRSLKNDLVSALERGQFFLHYQPQRTMSGEITAFEALVRWQCPRRGMVAPGTFIPIAEESRLIIPIGEQILRQACREAASWPQPLRLAVNISPIQFRHGDLPALVHSILLDTGLSPARLELEVTEGVLIDDFPRAVSILNRLKALGVQIAMDDFGSGFSSLSYVHSFPFDKIKIDRVFVSNLEHSRHSMAVVRAVIGLGRSLNVPILAEGVETKAQHAILVRAGCDEVQGFLIGRPLPIEDYAEEIGRSARTRASRGESAAG